MLWKWDVVFNCLCILIFEMIWYSCDFEMISRKFRQRLLFFCIFMVRYEVNIFDILTCVVILKFQFTNWHFVINFYNVTFLFVVISRNLLNIMVRKQISAFDPDRIIQMKENGKSFHAIAKKFNRDRKTIRKIWKRCVFLSSLKTGYFI